ncbi:MAG: PDZ domain-containing protein, partial [Gammaproteobacteria bacterium]|nr:PDZ domain-containing protein [Gammaproteobacteria bacterium]
MGVARNPNAWRLWPVLGTGILLGLLLAFIVGFAARPYAYPQMALLGTLPPVSTVPAADTVLSTNGALPASDTRLLGEVLRRVRAGYVDPVDEPQLLRQAARGLVAELDSHSALLEAADYAQLQAATSGSYVGIGVVVEGAADGLRVVRCLADSPAARAGLRAGDLIVRIDALEVGAANIDGATALLRGPPGSSVRLAVRRSAATEPPLRFQLTRSQVELPSVASASLAPGFGYLRIREFTAATPAETSAALRQLLASAGGKLRGLLIDLRDNPGGVLEAAGTVADDFLDHGTIVSAEGRLRDARFRMVATPGDLLDGAPIVVLVNGETASAAEILAAAL